MIIFHLKVLCARGCLVHYFLIEIHFVILLCFENYTKSLCNLNFLILLPFLDFI